MLKGIQNLRIKILLIALMGVVLTALSQFPVEERGKLAGAVITNLSDVNAIEFVTPSGTAVPVNNIVTIQEVYVDYTVAADAYVSGSDLENSPINFVFDGAPVAGVTIVGNKIYLPTTFAAFDIQISAPGLGVVSSADLTISPATCVDINSSLIRAYGNSLFFPDPADLPTPSVSDSVTPPFQFDGAPFDLTSIVLKYPLITPAAPYGSKTFHITANLVAGLEERAKITYTNGSGVYEIDVRDEGQDATLGPLTASNFAFVFDDLLGINSPFVPSVSGNIVHLATKELGDHTEDYVCVVNNATIANCFAGGTDGQNGAENLLTTPLALDNIITQGNTTLVYAGNSIGITEWTSSDPAVLEVSTLDQAEEQELADVSFASELLVDAAVYDPDEGSYVLSNCDEEPKNGDPITERSCDVKVTVPVTYDISGNNYKVNVAIGGEIVEVDVSGTQLVGSLTGQARWDHGVGISMNLTGKVEGIVTGTASGTATGVVTGRIASDINANVVVSSVALLDLDEVRDGFDDELTVINTGFLAELPNTFTSTVKLSNGNNVTNFSLLYAKRPGTAILTVKDERGCIAAMDIVVSEQRLILDMVGRDPDESFEVGDSVRINALIGSQDGEVQEMKNVSAEDGIEWFSSNPAVATIDQTGLATVLAPGKTNISARFDTGITEIGTLQSDPLLINVSKITGLTISLDENSRALLPTEFINNGHKVVSFVVNNPDVVGSTLVIEGQTVPITIGAGPFANDLERIASIVSVLSAALGNIKNSSLQDLLGVSLSDEFPGLFVLRPTNQNLDGNTNNVVDIDENDRIDISSTANPDDLSILPHFGNIINLPASVTYGLMVIAEYDNGKTKRLTPTEVEWVNTPANYLKSTSLESGVLGMGEFSGTSTVVARFTNADGSVVNSNTLVVVVDSGPAIDYLRRIGFGSILKGGRIHVQTKVTDVNTISDIQDIYVSLVRSNFSTYNEILADPDAVWFTATPFKEEVTVESVGETPPVVEGAEGTTPPPASPALQYRVYDIPVEIPITAGLFDGNYNLVLSISDAGNHTVNKTMPLYIGKIASGDINGDGKLTLVDVVLAFQIVVGKLANPTTTQLSAANMDNQGGVTMIDVILLFRRVASGVPV